jgi:hypothetical protein
LFSWTNFHHTPTPPLVRSLQVDESAAFDAQMLQATSIHGLEMWLGRRNKGSWRRILPSTARSERNKLDNHGDATPLGMEMMI